MHNISGCTGGRVLIGDHDYPCLQLCGLNKGTSYFLIKAALGFDEQHLLSFQTHFVNMPDIALIPDGIASSFRPGHDTSFQISAEKFFRYVHRQPFYNQRFNVTQEWFSRLIESCTPQYELQIRYDNLHLWGQISQSTIIFTLTDAHCQLNIVGNFDLPDSVIAQSLHPPFVDRKLSIDIRWYADDRVEVINGGDDAIDSEV